MLPHSEQPWWTQPLAGAPRSLAVVCPHRAVAVLWPMIKRMLLDWLDSCLSVDPLLCWLIGPPVCPGRAAWSSLTGSWCPCVLPACFALHTSVTCECSGQELALEPSRPSSGHGGCHRGRAELGSWGCLGPWCQSCLQLLPGPLALRVREYSHGGCQPPGPWCTRCMGAVPCLPHGLQPPSCFHQ